MIPRLLRLVVLALVVGLLAPPSGALARAPEINRSTEPYTFVIPADENPCGVEIVIEGETKVVEHLFFDANGEVVKVIASVNDQWTETGPTGTVYGQGTLSDVTTNIVHGDGVEMWTETFRGLPIMYSAPGVGVIARDAGTLTADRTLVLNDPEDDEDDVFSQEVIFEGGPHPLFDGPFTDAQAEQYCAVVAG